MKKYDPEYLQKACDIYAEVGGNKAELARKLDRPRATVQHIVNRFELEGLTPRTVPKVPGVEGLAEINERLRSELDATRQALSQATKPHFTVRNDYGHKSDTIRVCVMGDAHDSPKIPDKSRFEYAGKYCRESKPDVFVSIGDFMDLLSLCFHVPDENYTGRAKRTFLEDMSSAKDALEAFNCGLGSWKPEKHITLGNHENRLFRIEDSVPSSWGMYQSLFDEVINGAGLTYSPFGAYTFYGGVGFTHVPKSIMGRPYGGKNPSNQIGVDSVFDLVYGHTHVKSNHVARKINQRHITIVNAACYLPFGVVEDYAMHTPGGWDYGLTELTIRRGQIAESSFVSLETLEERYGKQA
jgi:hypothetical protein